jgi:hypothetical protein
VACGIVEMFYYTIEDDDDALQNPVDTRRVMMDIKHWQTQIELSLLGVYIIKRSGPPALRDVVMKLLQYAAEPAPIVRLPRDDANNLRARPEVLSNMSTKAHDARLIFVSNRYQFVNEMTLRMFKWFDLAKCPAADLNFLHMKIREIEPRLALEQDAERQTAGHVADVEPQDAEPADVIVDMDEDSEFEVDR